MRAHGCAGRIFAYRAMFRSPASIKASWSPFKLFQTMADDTVAGVRSARLFGVVALLSMWLAALVAFVLAIYMLPAAQSWFVTASPALSMNAAVAVVTVAMVLGYVAGARSSLRPGSKLCPLSPLASVTPVPVTHPPTLPPSHPVTHSHSHSARRAFEHG